MPATSATSSRGRVPQQGRAKQGKQGKAEKADSDPEILFQQFFKSVGPRTYVSQVKRAGNGNHFIVLTEGKRDEKTDEVRKTRLFVFSEDFVEFFKLMKATAEFVKAHPVPDEVKKQRARFWAKQADEAKPNPSIPSAGPGRRGR
jgi:hypothetical protein